MNKKANFIVQAGLIAAIYAVITILLAPFSYGQIQVRVSEALTILPFFTPAAIPGLFIGCLIANIFGGLGIVDIVFGSLATLVAAYLAYHLRRSVILLPLPSVLVNAVVVGIILNVLYALPLLASMLWVGLGQMIACYGLGLPLLLALKKYRHVFRRELSVQDQREE